MQAVRDQSRGEIVLMEELGQGGVILVYGTPAGDVEVLVGAVNVLVGIGRVVGHPALEGIHSAAGQSRSPERKSWHRFRIGIGETHAFRGEPVQVWCLNPIVAISADMVLTQ